MNESRFSALKDLKARTVEPLVDEPPQAINLATDVTQVKRGPGRPIGGKRSNPDYERISLIIRKATRRAVDFRMLKDDSDEDISDLVDRLLSEWAG